MEQITTNMASPLKVGVCVGLDQPFIHHLKILKGVQAFAKQPGWRLFVDERVLNPERYDGVLGRITPVIAGRLVDTFTPGVNVWKGAQITNLAQVHVNDETVGKMCADHLLERGFRSFAFLAEGDLPSQIEAASFTSQVEERGYACDHIGLPSNYSLTDEYWERAENEINDWIDHWQLPIGVRIRCETLARITIQSCVEKGLRIPRDVGIVSGMNEELMCDLEPSLSTIDYGFERIGYRAAEVLQELMDSGCGNSPAEEILMEPKGLFPRETTRPFVGSSPEVCRAIEFIENNLQHSIGQDSVAEAVSVERHTLQRRFRDEFDTPIAKVIRYLRIEKAKWFLGSTNVSIKEIAQKVGFSRPERLNEVFRREEGVSPTQYRQDQFR